MIEELWHHLSKKSIADKEVLVRFQRLIIVVESKTSSKPILEHLKCLSLMYNGSKQ